MLEHAKGPRKKRLRLTDTLFTGAGHPLTETTYDYDRDGLIVSTAKSFLYCEDGKRIPIRKTMRDAYGIIESELFMGVDGEPILVPRSLVYEEDDNGFIRRATSFSEHAGKQVGVIYHISGHGRYPHRRGLKSRCCFINPDGAFSHEYRYRYNKFGWRTHLYFSDTQDAPLSVKASWTILYDGHDCPIMYNEYLIDNTYDKDGLLREALVKKPNKKGWMEVVYRHEYTYADFPIGPPEPEDNIVMIQL